MGLHTEWMEHPMSTAATNYLSWTADKNAGPTHMNEHAALTAAIRVINGEDVATVAADMPSTSTDPADGSRYQSNSVRALGGPKGAKILRRTAGFMPKRGATDTDVVAVLALADALDAQ